MALKVLMLRKSLTDAKAELEALRTKDAELETREAEIATAIEEAKTDEERSAVSEAIEAFEVGRASHEEEKTCLERKIAEIEEAIAAEEAEQDTDPVPEHDSEKREDAKMSEVRTIAEMVKEERVRDFLAETRAAMREKRALTNVGLTVPEVMLGFLRENIMNYSKLYKHVNTRRIGGNGREVIMGTIPEAVWTDCCANLNELDLTFYDMELGCWRVGGYYAVCNANLEDSDINLASEILTAIGQAIGLSLDKAILYGTGTRMPLGVITRLAQQSKPADYSATARPWVDLHTSNIKSISADYTGVNLFTQIVLAAGNAKSQYSRGAKVWVMNETTYTTLIANAMSIDANGAIVAGVNGSMPVAGGVIEVLNFVPDNTIFCGYFDLYTLAERAGTQFATSEHVKFLQDRTVMKGTARYDGAPAIAEAFVVIGLGGSTPAANAVAFDPDKANSVEGIMINTTTATVAVDGTVQLIAQTYPGDGEITWASATTSKATVSSSGLVTGVASGSSVITATSNNKTASCTVTVTT